jgi:hypothetical protein
MISQRSDSDPKLKSTTPHSRYLRLQRRFGFHYPIMVKADDVFHQFSSYVPIRFVKVTDFAAGRNGLGGVAGGAAVRPPHPTPAQCDGAMAPPPIDEISEISGFPFSSTTIIFLNFFLKLHRRRHLGWWRNADRPVTAAVVLLWKKIGNH